MPSFAVTVMADTHPDRDEWVDDEARRAQQVLRMVPIDDEHYRGVWTSPYGGPVHIFALGADLVALEQLGHYVPPRCAECDCRVFPQDGPGVHATRCPYGWDQFRTCSECGARDGDRCVRPGTWPHPGRVSTLRTYPKERRRVPLR